MKIGGLCDDHGTMICVYIYIFTGYTMYIGTYVSLYTYVYIYIYVDIPVVPHKAVAEVSESDFYRN